MLLGEMCGEAIRNRSCLENWKGVTMVHKISLNVLGIHMLIFNMVELGILVTSYV